MALKKVSFSNFELALTCIQSCSCRRGFKACYAVDLLHVCMSTSAACTLILELLLGPSQVEVAFIHIQVPIIGKIFQLRVFPHALLTKAFTYSFEGRVAL